MSRIGIITFQKVLGNYGASLQCYALYKYLEKKGFNCEIIDLKRSDQLNYIESKFFKWNNNNKPNSSLFINRLKQAIACLIVKRPYTNNYSIRRKTKFENFNNELKYSKEYRSIDELYKNPPIYDIYISGSDQIWNPFIGFYNEPYFLTFASKNSKKISYASSLALNELPIEFHRFYQDWLSEYNSISVREASGKDIIERLSNKKVEVVLDPVFLIQPKIWKKISATPQINFKYILVYSLIYDFDLVNYAVSIANKLQYKVILLLSTNPNVKINKNVYFDKDAGPKEWLGYFFKASCVITDSFHGTAFSIMFGTPFQVKINSKERSSRISDLLEKFSLTSHCITNDFKKLEISMFDYKSVIRILENERKASEHFINESLN